jgi:hypothetical protein
MLYDISRAIILSRLFLAVFSGVKVMLSLTSKPRIPPKAKSTSHEARKRKRQRKEIAEGSVKTIPGKDSCARGLGKDRDERVPGESG